MANTRLELKRTLETLPKNYPEQPRIRRELTTEELEALAREGLTSKYNLKGETFADQIRDGREFWNLWSVGEITSDNFFNTPSITGDVVIDSNIRFLKGSHGLPLNLQQEMIYEYSRALQNKLGTDQIEAIMGEAIDYSAISFANYDMGNYEFPSFINGNSVRTTTKVRQNGYFATISLFDYQWHKRVNIGRLLPEDRNLWIVAVPLIVATQIQ